MDSRRVFLAFIKDRFNLSKDKAEYTAVIQEIRQSIYFRGTNLWILIFAVFIASVGLNMNSTAVVIGAMLISPLMGPIMGIGLGAGINDFKLIREASYNFAIAIVISLCASTIYFLITPLSEAHSELLARTTPTVYDVFIALFGGLAGIIAISSRFKGNVIPGVAIATALMPPLCTAGYGIAVGNFYYFAGALYLFFINSVFIGLATFLMTRFLKFPHVHYADVKTARNIKQLIYTIVILTFLPSVYIAYLMISKNVFEINVNKFVKQEMMFSDNIILERKINFKAKTIELVFIGKGVNPELIEIARKKLPVFHLEGAKLIVKQGLNAMPSSEITNIKSQILEELYKKNLDNSFSRDEKISLLEKELLKIQSGSFSGLMLNEVRALLPGIEEVSVSRSLIYVKKENKNDTVYLAYLKFRRQPGRAELERFENWLKERLQVKKIKLVIDKR